LIAENAKLPFPIPDQSVWTKQSMPALIVGLDRLLIRHGSPDESINLLYRQNLRPDTTHSSSQTNKHAQLTSSGAIFYDLVVVARDPHTAEFEGWWQA
jgi:hypothetical protein